MFDLPAMAATGICRGAYYVGGSWFAMRTVANADQARIYGRRGGTYPVGLLCRKTVGGIRAHSRGQRPLSETIVAPAWTLELDPATGVLSLEDVFPDDAETTIPRIHSLFATGRAA